MQATLKIIFLNILNNEKDLDSNMFDEFILDGEIHPIIGDSIEIKVNFNIYEKNLGVKICNYELIKKNKRYNFEAKGPIEILSGMNIGYCFIDVIGFNLDIAFLFLNDEKGCSQFLKNEFGVSMKNNCLDYNKSIKLKPNQNETKDRANLLLVNCPKELILNFTERIIIEEIINKVDKFNQSNTFQICFQNKDYKSFCYRKIDPIKELNFNEFYNNNYQKVNEIYEEIILILKSKDNNYIKCNKISAICWKNYNGEFRDIIFRKYTYSKEILEKELNQEKYIDLIFKVVFLAYLNIIKKENNEKAEYLLDIHEKLIKNKQKIMNDDSLRNYEKFLLILELYHSKLINNNDYIITYYNLRKIDDFSPLYFALKFINEFIDQLDEESNFYYPLLSIDSGFYNCIVKIKDDDKIKSTHGFNMLSLMEIKAHLKNLIPELLILSNDLFDEYATTNPMTGLITFDDSNFDGLNIDKLETNEYISKHYAFIIVKNLMHEYMGYKKSSFSKSIINYKSPISFKNKEGNLLFLSEKNDDDILYHDINEIIKDCNSNINMDQENGDSGYFIEYYFGKIDNVYTMKIIDNIEKDCNLGLLLDASLWHKNIELFKEYIKLNQDIINHYKDKINIDEDLDLPNQIINIKQQIEEIKLNEDKDKKEKEVSLLGLKKRRDNEESDSKIIKREKENDAKKNIYINNKNLSTRKGKETLFNKRLQKYPELRKYWDI